MQRDPEDPEDPEDPQILRRMRTLLAIAALVVMAGAASVSLEDMDFQAWKMKFDKGYGSEEEESQRKMIWLDNLKLVQEHNKLADQGLKSYRLGMNHLADLDHQEYLAMFTCSLESSDMNNMSSATPFFAKTDITALPTFVDWRAKGSVTGVKNQMSCGSCWAFSATGALEGQMFKKTGKLVSLSEQQLVDCSFQFGNNGCSGGWTSSAFEYVKDTGGLQTEESYSYENKEGVCKYNSRKASATCKGYKTLKGEEELLSALASVGPVSVSIDVRRRTFQLYKSGVYDEKYCTTNTLTHAVLAVGYGSEMDGRDYWLVKNSWGASWGDEGYIKMSRNKNNQCGIATRPVYPLV